MTERFGPFFRDWFKALGHTVPSCDKVEYHMRPYVRSKKDTWKAECAAVAEVINMLSKHYSLVPDGRVYLLLLSAYDRLGNLPAVPYFLTSSRGVLMFVQIVRLLTEMEANDCSTPQAHTIALEAAAKNKNLEVGQMLFQLAKSSHKVLIPSLYTSALKVAVQYETLDWARSLFADLLRLKPNAIQSQLPYP
jgi:hypothetical protein